MSGENIPMVQWSNFARAGREYAERVRKGEKFLILHNGEPIALVTPIDPKDVRVTIEAKVDTR